MQRPNLFQANSQPLGRTELFEEKKTSRASMGNANIWTNMKTHTAKIREQTLDKKSDPVRQCVVCKSRKPRKELIRFEAKQGMVCVAPKDPRRSFYACAQKACLAELNPKLISKVCRQKMLGLNIAMLLKEHCSHLS